MGAGKGPFKGYPKHVFLILGNEFCERFSFYGMKAILVLFLTRALGFNSNDATAIYHGFNVACYFMPIFGAMIADGLLGKYRTIFIISIVYAIGNVVMAIGAIPMDAQKYITAIPFVGLILIAIGTGGIKPCVSAFGADQFRENQVKEKETFFSMFYMAINLGSLMSMVITPILRSSVTCFQDNCYALAFGVPAILMLVAVVFFIAGSSLYTKHPPGDNVIGNLFGCIGKDFITDVKGVMRVLFMFLPLPVFWALFDQQGSRWTLQAEQMNGDLGGFVLQPDLIQVFNPLLVVLMVPLLESVIFPCLDRLSIPNRPLQRLGFGMFLAGTAFIVTAFIQITIDNSLPAKIDSGNARVSVMNVAPCDINFSIDGAVNTHAIEKYKSWTPADFEAKMNRTVHISFTSCKAAAGTPANISQSVQFDSGKAYNFITAVNAKDNGRLYTIEQTDTVRTNRGQAVIRFMNTLPNDVTAKIDDEGSTITVLSEKSSESLRVKHSSRTYKFKSNETGLDGPNVEIDAKAGAVYTVVLHTDETLNELTSTNFEVIDPNNVLILLQIPQYFTMSLGECFFSVTGLSFAYSQAPPSMKAVLQAAWLLTNSFGNLIVMIISAIGKLPSQTAEFFLFAGLMYATVIIFAIMSITFKYKEPAIPEQEEDEIKVGPPDEKGYVNYGMEKNDEHPPSYATVAEDVHSTYM